MNDPHEWDGWEGRTALDKAKNAEAQTETLAELFRTQQAQIISLRGTLNETLNVMKQLAIRVIQLEDWATKMSKGDPE